MKIAWYNFMSVFWRLALIATIPLTWIDYIEPSVWCLWWIVYFDERTQKGD